MSFVSEIEVMSSTGSLEWSCAINENDRVIYVVFLAEICEKLICDRIVSCRLKLCVKQIVRFRIDSSVQPILFIVKSNHRLINRNVIRASPRLWL